MHRYTVTWKPDAKLRLAVLWNDNPAIRQDISDAADRIDALLSLAPEEIGDPVSNRSRQYAEPPLLVLFCASAPDRTVRVIYVKLLFDD
jgi:hypothetical protein